MSKEENRKSPSRRVQLLTPILALSAGAPLCCMRQYDRLKSSQPDGRSRFNDHVICKTKHVDNTQGRSQMKVGLEVKQAY